MAKRTDALSLRAMREQGQTPEGLREGWQPPQPYEAAPAAVQAIAVQTTVQAAVAAAVQPGKQAVAATKEG